MKRIKKQNKFALFVRSCVLFEFDATLLQKIRYSRKFNIWNRKRVIDFSFWYIFSPLYFLFFIGFVSRIFFVSLQTDIKWDWTWKIICFPLLFPRSFHQPKLLFVAREKDRSEINLCKTSALMNCLGYQKFGKIVQKYGFIINSI